MSYTVLSKDGNEKIEYTASISFLILSQPIVLVTIAIFMMIVFISDTITRDDVNIVLFLFGPVLFVGSIFQLIKLLFYIFTTKIIKTNKKILFKTGFIAIEIVEIPLSQIECIKISQSMFGRIFKFGNLTIIGAGGTHQDIEYIANIHKFI